MTHELELLSGVISPELITRAKDVSQRLHEHGIPHALVGELAVAAHDHARATRDVDFLVGA